MYYGYQAGYTAPDPRQPHMPAQPGLMLARAYILPSDIYKGFLPGRSS